MELYWLPAHKNSRQRKSLQNSIKFCYDHTDTSYVLFHVHFITKEYYGNIMQNADI